VLVVEGDAENILLPVIARLLDRDLHEYGVSIVNVGGVGLGRYARIFMRKDSERDGILDIPVACVTDLDVMPDMAPWIVGKLEEGEQIPKRPPSKRKWCIKADFPGDELEQRRKARREKASGQRVETFVADEWTLEYDLAFHGLGEFVWRAAVLAIKDDQLHSGKVEMADVIAAADADFQTLVAENFDKPTFASHVYAKFEVDGASKAIAAQYLAELLEKQKEEQEKEGTFDVGSLRRQLPPYLVAAIAFVTSPFETTEQPQPAQVAAEK